MTNGSRNGCRCRQVCTTTKQVSCSANSIGKETNQFDETGVVGMCNDKTATTTLS